MEENLYTQIEDYLDHIMNDAERKSFEAELSRNPAMAEALEQVREARDRLQRMWQNETSDAQLEETLQRLGGEYFAAGAVKKTGGGAGGGKQFRLPMAWWALAAGTAAVVVAWLLLRPVSSEQLYAQYRDFQEASFTLMGNDTTQQNAQTAAEAFNKRDYATASKALEAYLKTHPNELEAQLYSGLCDLELGRYNRAIPTFQKIRATPNNAWAEEATWYLALTYLRQNNRNQCIKTLRSIPQNSGRYGVAQQLLKAM